MISTGLEFQGVKDQHFPKQQVNQGCKLSTDETIEQFNGLVYCKCEETDNCKPWSFCGAFYSHSCLANCVF
jgi:hypothetical protein